MNLENIVALPIGDIAIIEITHAIDGTALASQLADFTCA